MKKKLSVSNRSKKMPASPIRKLTPYAAKAKANKTEVYHLNIGQPDIRSPKEFFDGLTQFNNDVLAYERSQGLNKLCVSWSSILEKSIGVEINPENMMITNGGSEALIFAFTTICDPGDEVILFDPTYANYIGFAAFCGIKLVPVPTKIEDGFSLPPIPEIAKKITPRTKAVLLCNPNNPTGAVLNRNDLRMVLDLCEQKNLFLICDEVYREFVYDGQKPCSILNIDSKSERIVVVDSLSKHYSLCGARIGCMITNNKEIYQRSLCIAQARLASPTLEQMAASYMLDHISDHYMADVRSEYENRRNVLYENLQAVPGITAHKPRGAFYSVVSLPVKDSEDFAIFMLNDFSCDNKTTFVAPASGFYIENPRKNEVRIAYVLESTDIKNAIQILGAGLEKYNKLKG